MREKFRQWVQARSLQELILAGIVITSTLSLLITLIDTPSGGQAIRWLSTWLMDFSTDLAGGVAAFLLIRWFLLQQDQKTLEAKQEKVTKQPLFETLPVRDDEVIEGEAESIPEPEPQIRTLTREELLNGILPALKAARTPESRQLVLDNLRTQNFLESIQLPDVDLYRAYLEGANLQGADLTKANLREASLRRANLQQANLYMTQLIEANLQQADLRGAQLERAFMSGADMEGSILRRASVKTSLWGVNLRNADLAEADLNGAELFRTDLSGANLAGAKLEGVKINPETILPDGSLWDKKVDLSRFTDKKHPQYWRSTDPRSPAFDSYERVS